MNAESLIPLTPSADIRLGFRPERCGDGVIDRLPAENAAHDRRQISNRADNRPSLDRGESNRAFTQSVERDIPEGLEFIPRGIGSDRSGRNECRGDACEVWRGRKR